MALLPGGVMSMLRPLSSNENKHVDESIHPDSINVRSPDTMVEEDKERDVEEYEQEEEEEKEQESLHLEEPDDDNEDPMDIVEEEEEKDEESVLVPSPPQKPAPVARIERIVKKKAAAAVAPPPPQKKKKEPLRISIRHTKNPYARNREERHTRQLFTAADATRVNSRYVDHMKPLRRKPTLVIRQEQQQSGATRLNVKPVVIRTKYRQLAVAPKELLEGCTSDNDKELLSSLSKWGRIIPQSLWMRYIMANARRYRKCQSVFMSLDIALLAFMINIMFDSTELNNGERHRIDETSLKYVVNHVWTVRNAPRASYPH
jgi:hypothetical protein